MFENSPAGISLLAGQVPVTVTREEDHQATLARYSVSPGGQRTVVVELTWCTIRTGQHRGQRAIEVRLDGHRVGELTYLMSQRYGGLVEQIAAAGGRPGCPAVIERNARGLQLTLRLPKNTERVVPLATEKRRHTHSERRAMWIVAGAVVFLIFLFTTIFGGADEPAHPAAPATETTETTTTTYEPPPTTTTTTTTTTTEPPPPPPPTRETVAPPVVETPAPVCDPNYTGCVPIASDVDCAGGSGNGPAYAEGPVDVVGSDIYDLDGNGDGVACE